MVEERYENLNGIRGYSCMGIVLMHVLTNGNFGLTGFVFEKFIPSFTNFTLLFMLLSAFSMCCGYYERIQDGTISLERFYKRRYQRIWPFFAVLCTAELIFDHSLNSLYEWLADLTLAFGFIPDNKIDVVGVGWFLGIIFVFYMIFPYFVFLMKNKRRAWSVMAVCLVLHILCIVRFDGANSRENIIYSAIFFVAGGMIYLYRNELKNMGRLWKNVMVIASVICTVLYYFLYDIPLSVVLLLLMFTLFTTDAICFGGGTARFLFQNKIACFLGGLSMEIYLCHMFVYRFFEKLHLLHVIENKIMNYCLVSLVTIVGAVIIAFCWSKLQKKSEMLVKEISKGD